MRIYGWVFGLVVVAGYVVGCSSEQGGTPYGEADQAPAAEEHEHHHEGPNGGHVVELSDDHSVHGEFVIDTTAKVARFYLLGEDLKTPVEGTAVTNFFTTSTRNLLKYAAAAGVKHYVALSVVGTERIPESPYLRAKNAQEMLIKEDGIPYSIVHATQFFEFIKRIADEATDGTTIRLPPVLIQPMAAVDVAKAVGSVAIGTPLNGTLEVAGPQRFRFDDLIRQGLAVRHDPREVVVDPHARYFGAELGERSLIPGDGARLGEIRFQEWLGQPAVQQH